MHQNDLDKFKLRMQRAVLERASIETLRAKGIANMDRWEAKGTWCSAQEEWRALLTTGTDAEIIDAMTGEDERANRLRQSSPFTGIIDQETRSLIWDEVVREHHAAQKNKKSTRAS